MRFASVMTDVVSALFSKTDLVLQEPQLEGQDLMEVDVELDRKIDHQLQDLETQVIFEGLETKDYKRWKAEILS